MQTASTDYGVTIPTPPPATSSFSVTRNAIPSRQSIALISEPGDPAADTSHEAAGAQNVYVRQVGEALAKLGWQVDMFTRKSRASDDSIVNHGPHCRTIRLSAGPEKVMPRDQLFQYMPEFVDSFLKFQAKDGGNYPLVHTNYWISGWVGLQLQKERNMQLVHTYHSLGAIKYQSLARSSMTQTRLNTERELLEKAQCIVANSPEEQDHLRSLVSNQGYIEVIPCGTDTDTFRLMPQDLARKTLGFGSTEKIVLYVGRFDPRKGIETLVRAFAALYSNAKASLQSNLRLVIVGGTEPGQVDDDERARIETLVAELGIAAATTFVGQVGHDRLPDYYTAADVCVIPSHFEPFGLVAIEAMACGTPVIASNVGGLKFTVVPGENGLLVNAQDVPGFASAMEQVLTHFDWSSEARTQANHWVQEHFSWTGAAVQLSNLYRRLLVESLMETPIHAVPDPILPQSALKISA